MGGVKKTDSGFCGGADAIDSWLLLLIAGKTLIKISCCCACSPRPAPERTRLRPEMKGAVLRFRMLDAASMCQDFLHSRPEGLGVLRRLNCRYLFLIEKIKMALFLHPTSAYQMTPRSSARVERDLFDRVTVIAWSRLGLDDDAKIRVHGPIRSTACNTAALVQRSELRATVSEKVTYGIRFRRL